MIGYASLTTNARNLAVLRRAGWRLIISAKRDRRHRLPQEGLRYALDNGAWWSFRNQCEFDGAAFLAAYRELGPGADFAVLPDIVAGGDRSLALSLRWRGELGEPVCPLLLPVQDGMAAGAIAALVGPELGIFVGGSSEFKEATLAVWGAIAVERQAYLHVGRVNTARRIALCAAAGAASFDGSSVSRYSDTLPLLDLARRQPDLFGVKTLLEENP